MLLNGLTKLINEYKEVQLQMATHIKLQYHTVEFYLYLLNNICPCRILNYYVLPTLLLESCQGIMK